MFRKFGKGLIATLAISVALLVGQQAMAQSSFAGFFKRSGVAILPFNTTWELGSSSQRIAKGWFTDLDATTITIGGAATGPMLLGNGTASAPSYSFSGDTNTGMYSGGTDILSFTTGGTARFSIDASGNQTITQGVVTTGSPTALTLTGGAHTTLTASTEAIDVYFNLARTVQFETGGISLQRAVYIGPPTYAAVGATTITTAIGLDVDAPVAGTNVTITNRYAARFNGQVIVNNVLYTASSVASQIIMTTSAGSLSGISTSAADSGILLTGNRTAAAGGSDVYIRTAATRTAGLLLAVQNSSTGKFGVGFQGQITSTPAANASGTIAMFTITNANHTNQTLSTEIINFNLTAYTRQWATGAITTQREVFFGQPTYGFVGASTITDAANVYIQGAPVAGTNATLTNTYALWLDDGAARFDGRVLRAQGADVASATNLTLGTDGNSFELTGTTKVDLISNVNWTEGSTVTLIANESVVIDHGTATSGTNIQIKLSGAVDYSMTADDTLTLILSSTTAGGQVWREVGRSVN